MGHGFGCAEVITAGFTIPQTVKGNGESGKSGEGQTTNNVGDVNNVKSLGDIEKKLMSNIQASQDVAGSLEGIKKDIIDGMGYGKLVEDAARITRAGTQQALDMAERLEKRKGHEINGSQSDESVSGNSIEVQQRLVKVVEEQLELMRSLPEMYTPEDIAKVEEELRKEQIKLDILTGADSKNTTIDSGEEAPENDDEWIKKWIDGYDTSQEYGLKRIIQELKNSKIMHYNEFGIEMGDEESDYKESFLERNESRDRYKKISLVYWQLQQMLKKM